MVQVPEIRQEARVLIIQVATARRMTQSRPSLHRSK